MKHNVDTSHILSRLALKIVPGSPSCKYMAIHILNDMTYIPNSMFFTPSTDISAEIFRI